MAENGTFYWNELVTTDVDAAKDFYADVVGWQYERWIWERAATIGW